MNETQNSVLLWSGAIALVISLISCGALAYVWVDLVISYKYLKASYDETEGYRNVSALLEREWSGQTEQDTLRRLQAEARSRSDKHSIVKQEQAENVIWFDNTRFEFSNGRLTRIR